MHISKSLLSPPFWESFLTLFLLILMYVIYYNIRILLYFDRFAFILDPTLVEKFSQLFHDTYILRYSHWIAFYNIVLVVVLTRRPPVLRR